MSFLETVEKARAFLERNGRVSLRALQREFNLDDGALGELIEELVEIQRVAVREGRALGWAGGVHPAPIETPEHGHAPRDYTPKHLADKILQSKSALEGERKQVTALFADVKGSMELSEAMDPEEWHAILDRFFQILTDGVHRFEGTVNQYTGDGMMALFGAPIAHEDHAQRACWTALHLRDALRGYADELRLERGLNFSVRMGLNSGAVVVGKIGDDLRMDYTAQGHTVGLAARMQQIAAADQVYLAQPTAALVEGLFRLRDIGASRVKGVEEAVHVYQLEGIGPLRTRFDVSRARGLTKFVGRGDETAILEGALQRSIEGQGQVVGVVGEAGVGKSRLCFEFAERCRARGVPVFEAHGLPHGKGVPLLPVLELARATFGIGERDADQAARDKIAGRILLLDRELEESLPLFFDFLGVPDPERSAPRLDPEVRERRLFDALRRLTQARSRREPEVLLVEDLHWIDAASDAFLGHFADAVQGSRTLLLVNFRPEYHARWMQKSGYQQVSLLPLGAEAVRELLAGLLGPDPALVSLADRIHEHTGGNPFFVEESVRSLQEAGALEGGRGAYRLARPVEEPAIPATVQAVLAARIDRLPEREKQVLQAASVLGRRFGASLLGRVANLPEAELAAAMRSLTDAEFVHEEVLYPEAEYAFAHPLTREVAYGSQLGEWRRQVHAAAAHALEELEAQRLDERAGLLAHHWESAGEPLQAARWHRRAAVWAGAAHSQEALRHWRRVRALLRGVAESPETLALGVEAGAQVLLVGARTRRLDEDVDALRAEAEDLAERSRNPRSPILVRFAYALYQIYSGTPAAALEALRECVELADELRDASLGVAARYYHAILLCGMGPLDGALSLHDEALALLDEDPGLGSELVGFEMGPFVRGTRAATLAFMGRMAEGTAEAGAAFDLARANGAPGCLATAECNRAWVALAVGNGPAALAHGRRAAEFAEEDGAVSTLALSYAALGHACVSEARWHEAVEALERAGEHGPARLQVQAQLARAWLGLGDTDRARRAADDGVAATRTSGARVLEIAAQLALASVLLQTEGAPARASVEAALSRADHLVHETAYLASEPLVHLERAQLMSVLGDPAARERELREAHRLFNELGATGHAERVARELDS